MPARIESALEDSKTERIYTSTRKESSCSEKQNRVRRITLKVFTLKG